MDKNIHSKVIQLQYNMGANRWVEEITWDYHEDRLGEIAKDLEAFFELDENQGLEWRVIVIEEYILHTEEEFEWENHLA